MLAAGFQRSSSRASLVSTPSLRCDDVVQDRLADRDLFVGADRLCELRRTLRLELLGVRVDQHDAAAVGLDPLEDQLHDAVEQLVDVLRVADGQRRAIHDLQVAAGPGRARSLRQSATGASKIRCPSCCVIERTIREPSSDVAGATMSILSDRSPTSDVAADR